jgi:CHAD domain-containing protein
MTISAALLRRTKRLRSRLLRLQRNVSIRNVHDFRIACRELLACHALLKGLAPDLHLKKLLKKALNSLDTLRDLQQMQRRLSKDPGLKSKSIAKALEQPLKHALASSEAVSPDLPAEELLFAIATLEPFLRAEQPKPADLHEIWRKEWRKSLREVRARLDSACEDDLDNLHRLRIHYKQLRYLLELELDAGASPPVSKAAMKHWQDALGNIADCRATLHYARKMELPPDLQQKLQLQATKQARHFLKKREAFHSLLDECDQYAQKQPD